jgi:hypothetical protein
MALGVSILLQAIERFVSLQRKASQCETRRPALIGNSFS